MEWIAVIADGKVMEITSNEDASLDAMQAYVRLGYRRLSRVLANDDAYIRMANGDVLFVHPVIEDGAIVGHKFLSAEFSHR